MLAALLPLFPLPRLVLLPGATVGLHLFEPRYRAMIRDVLDQGTGFILARTRVETGTDIVPPEADLHPVGTRVSILAHERLPDGRFNVRVQGLAAVRVQEEGSPHPYRMARWEPLPWGSETWSAEEQASLARSLRQFLNQLNLAMDSLDKVELESIEVHELPALAAGLDLPLPEQQFLLESSSPRDFALRLTALLDFACAGRTLPGP
ncbi:MAG: LON peptidase substrate-binding domain-containing protein [Holophagaceae bacterium]